MPAVLVTDGHSRAALAGVRALGRAGIGVRVLSSTRWPAAAWSRHAAARDSGPPSDDEHAFVARIGEVVRAHGEHIVFPGQEQAVLALARHAAALDAGAILPYPGPEAMLALADKTTAGTLATAAGIAPPATLAAGTAGAIAADPPPAPCVVKSPALSSALPEARVCETASDLAALLAALPPEEPVILQERATGSLDALSLVLDRDGAVAASFASRALRLSPAKAGASSLSVSIAADPELVARAAGMLRELGWWGLAHMQFLRTERGPALIDVNIRFYGSLPLATAAGVNLPAIWYRVAAGEPTRPAPPYRLGVRYRWLEGDVVEGLRGEPRRLATVPARRSAGAMWLAEDPLPSAMLAGDALKPYAIGALRRVARRLGVGRPPSGRG